MFIPVVTYLITASVAATDYVPIPEIDQLREKGLLPQLEIHATTAPIVFRLGKSNGDPATPTDEAKADKTITSFKLAAGNKYQGYGPHVPYGVEKNQNAISLISYDGVTTPLVAVTVGYGEQL